MKSKDVFDILEAWYTERKKHKDKTFKQWLKHVGSLWTSKEEWAKVVRWESYRHIPKEVGKKTGKLLLTKILIIIVLISLTAIGID